MFLRITNCGSLNRKKLELVGSSTKRDRVDDITVIGNKGSGAKLSTIAAMRLGLDLAISSTDYLGSYVLTYTTQDVEIDGQIEQQIVFRYWKQADDGSFSHKDMPWCMTVNAFQDWDQCIGDDDKEAFKVIREFICNAIDEDADFEIDFVEKPHFVTPGETAVFLKYTDEINEIFRDADQYFKFLAERLGDGTPRGIITVDGVGEIHPKSDIKKTRLFVLGVMVECASGHWMRSLYDYSLYRKDLISEERIIKNLSAYLKELGTLIVRIGDVGKAAMFLAAAYKGIGMLERRAFGLVRSLSAFECDLWTRAAEECFGKDLCVASGIDQIDGDAAQLYGYNVKTLPDQLGVFLKLAGVPAAEDVVPKTPSLEPLSLRSVDKESVDRFLEAFRLFQRHFPQRASVPVVFFRPLDNKAKKVAGFTRGKQVWIAAKEDKTLPSVIDLYKTLVHESRHIATGAGDYDRQFINAADDDVALVTWRAEEREELEDGKPVPIYGDGKTSPVVILPRVVDDDDA